MGQEIVYCHKCSTRLLGSDFEKGKAFRINYNATCEDCAKGLMDQLSPEDRETLLMGKPKPQKGSSASYAADPVQNTPRGGMGAVFPKPGPGTSRRGPEEKSPMTVVYASVGGLIVLVLVAIFVTSSGGPAKPSPGPADLSRTDPPIPPPIPPPVPPNPDPVNYEARETAAREALNAARQHANQNKADPGATLQLYERCVTIAGGTTVLADAQKERDALKTRVGALMATELAALREKADALSGKGEFRAALDLLEASRRRFPDLEWTAGIQKSTAAVNEAARKALGPLRDQAAAAQRRGAATEVQRLRDQISGWGLAALLEEFERSLPAETKPPKDPPPPPIAPPSNRSKEAQAYDLRWEKAATFAAGRAFAEAIKELEGALPAIQEPVLKTEAAADLEDLKLAATLHAEALQALQKWPRGHNLAAQVLDENGNARALDEPVVRAEPSRLEVRAEKGTAFVELGEITAASLADLFLARPAKKETDARAAAIACLLEGDEAGAGRHKAAALPAKYAAFSARRGSADARESEARKLFHEAEAGYRAYSTRVSAVPKYAKLQGELADTSFVRRNRASIEGRADAGKEYFFGPADMDANGFFRFARHPKGEAAWTMEDNVTDKAKRIAHYLELKFSCLAGAEYKAWVFAGGCCQETFSFHLQGTEFPGQAEPGSAATVPVTLTHSSLKKFHVMHGGPKEPVRWEWVPLTLPKYAQAGEKVLRVISDQEGYSVAFVLLSQTRKAPPRESEMDEMARLRPGLSEGAAGEGAARTGKILREWWFDIPDTKVQALKDNPNYPNRPSGKDLLDLFETPRDFADNFGTRVRGFVHPPATGEYVFWIAGDDDTELSLSPDDDPASKKRIAGHTGAVGPRAWTTHADQKSPPILLQKGRRYYIEALVKEGGGGDHLAVGWTLPGGAEERPIPGNRLSLWTPGARRFSVEFVTPAPGATVAPGSPVVVTAGFHGGTLARAEVFLGSTKLSDLRMAGGTPTYTWSNVPVGNHPLTLRALDKTGAVALSAPVVLRVGEIGFYRGINLNGPAVTIDDQRWEGRDAKEYTKTGAGFERQGADLRPPADPDRASMIRSCISSREGTRVTLTAIPPGTYLVYLTTWAREEPQAFDLLLKGKTLVSGFRPLAAGDWARHGPWSVEVADGSIDVLAAKGTAHFSGIEAWRVGGGGAAPVAREPGEATKTELVGGPGGDEFEEAQKAGNFLTGFKLSLTPGAAFIRSVQPVFQGSGGRFEGEVHGGLEPDLREVVARPGYAVAGLVARGGERMTAMKVVFMKISGKVLDPKDVYESEWFGAASGGAEKRLVGTGAPVVGIHGRTGSDLDALGLVYLK